MRSFSVVGGSSLFKLLLLVLFVSVANVQPAIGGTAPTACRSADQLSELVNQPELPSSLELFSGEKALASADALSCVVEPGPGGQPIYDPEVSVDCFCNCSNGCVYKYYSLCLRSLCIPGLCT
jgi:hypothetical protein